MSTGTAIASTSVAPSGEGLDAETLGMMLQAIRDFTSHALDDERILELDHIDECPEDVVRGMCSDPLGVHLIFVAEQYGGMGGSTFDVYRVCETMGRFDLGVATSVLATFLGSDPILVGATDDQKARWLGEIAEHGTLYAYGATEPEAGSDLGALKTVAKPVTENGEVTGYTITGRKQWISNGGIADAWTILAMAPGGPTWFVLKRGAEGFAAAKPEDKHGIRLSNTCALYLDDVYIPAEDVIGLEEGQGLIQAQLVFGYTRLMVAAFGLGAGVEAVDRAIKYSMERTQGGAPLSEKQGYTHKLIVPHVVRLEAGRAYIEETATRIDSGEGSLNTEGAIAKYTATEAGNDAAEAAIQAHGGYGYTREYFVEKIKRDVRITTIYEGTSEIMEMTIARDRWQQHLKTRGGYYHDLAAQHEMLHATSPTVGADVAALGFHAMAEVMERARIGRLTRNQHILFRLGELIAAIECSGALCRRAAAALNGTLSDKADRTYGPEALAAMARVAAREAALKVGLEGLRWVRGAATADAPDVATGLEAALGLPAIEEAQAGMVADMDAIADALYGRSA
jgi:alkylation response protein AidB-like acyl-CoA dehydrogenase